MDNKQRLIARLNLAIEERLSRYLYRKYNAPLNDIQGTLLNKLEQNETITKEDVREVQKNTEFPIDSFAVTVMSSFVVMQIISIIENGRSIAPKEKKNASPILELMKIVPPNRPNELVDKVVNFSVRYVNNVTTNDKLTDRDRSIAENINEFLDARKKIIAPTTNQFKKDMRIINNKITTNLSRQIFQDYQNLRKRQYSFDDLKAELNTRFSNAKVRTERILRTEIHAQNELVAQTTAQFNGYSYKKWIPEDREFRETPFHKSVANKTIGINEKYEYYGMSAMYPGDTSLPPGERINCRCRLQYIKG